MARTRKLYSQKKVAPDRWDFPGWELYGQGKTASLRWVFWTARPRGCYIAGDRAAAARALGGAPEPRPAQNPAKTAHTAFAPFRARERRTPANSRLGAPARQPIRTAWPLIPGSWPPGYDWDQLGHSLGLKQNGPGLGCVFARKEHRHAKARKVRAKCTPTIHGPSPITGDGVMGWWG